MLKKVFNITLCSVVTLVLVAVIIVTSILTVPSSNNKTVILGFYAEEDNTLDAVYIGGSACFVFWEPLRAYNNYGIASYNFANNSISAIAIKYYIEEVLKTQSPELLIIDARPFQYGGELSSNGVKWMYDEVALRNGIDCMKLSSTRINLINAGVPSFFERFNYYFSITKYHSLFPVVITNVKKLLINKDRTVFDYLKNEKENKNKGFVFVEKTAELTFTDYSDVTDEADLDEEVEPVFIDLLEYCSKLDTKVLFVVSSYVQTEEDKKMYNYMARMVNSYGMDFLNANDYYEEIGLDFSMDLYNDDHVNVFGADKYTDFLGQYIVEHYDLPDRRTDSAYDRWKTLYADYEETCTRVKNNILKIKADGDEQDE